jgi:hypothetical protein
MALTRGSLGGYEFERMVVLSSLFRNLEIANALYWHRNVRSGGPKLRPRIGTELTGGHSVERLSKIDLP